MLQVFQIPECSWQAYYSWQAPVGKPTACYAAVARPTAGSPAAGGTAAGPRTYLAGLLQAMLGRPSAAGWLQLASLRQAMLQLPSP